jgi:hypothetical protein
MSDEVVSGSGDDRNAFFSRKPLLRMKIEAYLGGLRRASEGKSFVEILKKTRARASGEIGQGLPCFPDQRNSLSCLFGQYYSSAMYLLPE